MDELEGHIQALALGVERKLHDEMVKKLGGSSGAHRQAGNLLCYLPQTPSKQMTQAPEQGSTQSPSGLPGSAPASAQSASSSHSMIPPLPQFSSLTQSPAKSAQGSTQLSARSVVYPVSPLVLSARSAHSPEGSTQSSPSKVHLFSPLVLSAQSPCSRPDSPPFRAMVEDSPPLRAMVEAQPWHPWLPPHPVEHWGTALQDHVMEHIEFRQRYREQRLARLPLAVIDESRLLQFASVQRPSNPRWRI